MSNRYTRRINLYINGKEVKNDISSITKEMYRLTNEQRRMTLGSKEYNAQARNIRQLKGILADHQAQLRTTTSLWQKAKDIFSKFAPAAGFAAIGAGIMRFAKQSDEAFTNLEERVNNLSALTGLEGEQLEWLTQKAKETSVSTVEGNIRIKQSADAIIDAYTKVGSKRPELLKSKEALALVAQEAIILSEAAKTELEPAVSGLTMALNQFDMKAEESRRIINVLAAGSKAGAGDIPYLTEAMEKSGTTANLMGIGIEQWAGAIESVAPYYEQASMAGNSFDKVLLKMKEKQIGYVNGVFDMNTALDQLEKMYASGKSSAQIFGVEHSKMGELLVKERGNMDEYTKAVTNSNVAIEQAAKNTSGEMAKRAQEMNRIKLVMIDFGKTISPIITQSMGAGRKLIEVLFGIFKMLIDNKGLLISVTATITAYTIATKLAVMWQNRSNTATIASIVAQKLQALAFHAQFAAIALYNTIVALMTGKLKVAAIQFRAFSAALAANPVGLVVGAVVALGAGLYMLSKRLTDTEKLQRTLNNVNLEAEKQIVEERLQVEQLLKVAQNELRSKKDRLAAVKKLNEISPDYLGSLTLETINTDDATKATNKYITSLREKAKVMAAQEKLVEIEKELIDLQTGELSFWDKAIARLFTYNNGINVLYNGESSKAKLIADSQKALLLQKEKLLEITEKQYNIDNKPGAGESTPKTEPGGGSGTPVTKEKAYATNDSAEAAEKIAIKKQLLDKLITEEQANEALLAVEIEFLEKKKALQIKFGDDYQSTEAAIIDKKLQAAKDADKKSEDETKKAHDKILKDLDNKEAEKLNVIKEQLAEKQITEEQAQQDLLLIEIEFLNQRIAIRTQWGEDTAELEGKVFDKINQIAENALEGDKARAKTLYDLRRDFEDPEVAKAREKAAALAELDMLQKAGMLASEEEYQNLKTKIVEKYEGTRLQKTSDYLSAANDILGGASDFFGNLKDAELAKAGDNAEKRAEIEKKYAGKQKALAIGMAVIAGAQAILQLWAQPSVIPSPANEIYKGVMTAVIAGTTIAQVAKIKSAKFATGGYTNGARMYMAGEAGTEWIAPNWMVQNPATANIIASLDQLRGNRIGLSQAALPAMAKGGYSSSSNVPNLGDERSGGGQRKLTSPTLDLDKFDQAIDKLLTWEPAVVITEVKERLDRLERRNQQSKLN